MFSRTELLIGKDGVRRLRACKVAVFGLGGVGSYAAEALARAGVENFILVDYDTVNSSNINRQLHALTSTVGLFKADLMAQRFKLINNNIEVLVIRDKFAPGMEHILDPHPDYVVDAIDDVMGKTHLIKCCVESGINIISSMGAGNKLDPTSFKVGDISETTVCPLARTMRKKLRQLGIDSGVKVVYSQERPIKIETIKDSSPGGNPSGEPRRVTPGSISFVPSTAGLIMASVVVKDLLKKPLSF